MTGPNACISSTECDGNDWYRQGDIGPGDPVLAIIGQLPNDGSQVRTNPPTSNPGDAQTVPATNSVMGDDAFYQTGTVGSDGAYHSGGPPSIGATDLPGVGPAVLLNSTPLRSPDYPNFVYTSRAVASTNDLSVELWCRASPGSGRGGLAGFYSSIHGTGSDDRLVWLNTAGHLNWGVFPGRKSEVTSPGVYNDGKWHYLVVTLASTENPGQRLYVDGNLAASAVNNSAFNYPDGGYWRFGWDPGLSADGWAASTQQDAFEGALADVAIYDRSLNPSEVTAHYGAASSAYEAAVAAGRPQEWYKFRDTVPPGDPRD